MSKWSGLFDCIDEENLMSSRNIVRVLLALLLLSFSAQAAEKISKETLESQGRKRTYYLFVPSSVTKATKPVPLLVLLHGSGRNGLSLVEKWKELADANGFIIVGPDASDTQRWRVPEDGPDFIRDLVEALKGRYPINPRQVYLFGHSAGAVFALNLSMMESEYFAATAVHAGSWRDAKEFSVMDYARRKSPLAIFVGDRDQFFSLSSVKATEGALLKQGFPVQVTVIKGHDHNYYDSAAEINRNAWDFLTKYTLGEEPRYVAYNQTGEADVVNGAVREINALRVKFNELQRRFNAKEDELRGKDYERDKQLVAEIARAQIALLDEGAEALRESATKAESVSKMKLKGNYAQYFSLLAQVDRKRVEALEVMRERTTILLSGEPRSTIIMKRNEAAGRAEILNREAGELEQRVARIQSGQDK
jgi:poly(3-hydroxybutyrate) depolymerase